MHITLQFIQLFSIMIFYVSPLLLFLIAIITILGLIIGRTENWSKIDSLYYAFITATTVGYGDFRPTKTVSKILAIFIAFTGIIFTGLLVALALHAVAKVFGSV